jgi:hypothetical protein
LHAGTHAHDHDHPGHERAPHDDHSH